MSKSSPILLRPQNGQPYIIRKSKIKRTTITFICSDFSLEYCNLSVIFVRNKIKVESVTSYTSNIRLVVEPY